jgi:hypothetical protein
MILKVVALIWSRNTALSQDTIKVGVLHSLSGTMAISETTLKDTMLMPDRRAEQEGRRARQASSKPWSSTRPRTGRCSPKRPAS